jgi:hypothetical protein
MIPKLSRDWDYLLSRKPLFKPGRHVRSIYPSANGEGKRNAVERRHNIIIADKQNIFQARLGNYFNIKSAPLSGCRSQGLSAGCDRIIPGCLRGSASAAIIDFMLTMSFRPCRNNPLYLSYNGLHYVNIALV